MNDYQDYLLKLHALEVPACLGPRLRGGRLVAPVQAVRRGW